MPEQLPEPPKNFNETTPLHQRTGTKPINPIVEHYNQVSGAKFLGPDQTT